MAQPVREIHVGDIGTRFEITMVDQDDGVVNLTGSTTRQFKYKRPDNVVFTRTAFILNSPGTDGILYYDSQAGDLTLRGKWKIQAYVKFTTGEWHSDTGSFTVYPILE